MNLYSSFRSADEKTGEEDANNTDDAVSRESEPSLNIESQLPTPVLCQAIQEDKSTNLNEQQNKIKSNQRKSTVTIEVLKQVENVPPITWLRIARVLDRFLSLVYSILSIINFCIFLLPLLLMPIPSGDNDKYNADNQNQNF